MRQNQQEIINCHRGTTWYCADFNFLKLEAYALSGLLHKGTRESPFPQGFPGSNPGGGV